MKLRPVDSGKLSKPQKNGICYSATKGKPCIFKHSDGRATVVPVHKGEEIGRGLLRKIIKDVKFSRKEFLELLEEL